jgi:gluconokinase
VKAIVIVMGVSGSGKSVVGTLLAYRLGVPFCEGDALHPAANIAKMAAGEPLDDADRAPWLAQVAAWIAAQQEGGVVSCSALKRAYRDRLRRGQAVPPAFVLLDPPHAVLESRMAARPGHFMPLRLLDSQLATLERPTSDEQALRLGAVEAPDAVAQAIVAWLGDRSSRDQVAGST